MRPVPFVAAVCGVLLLTVLLSSYSGPGGQGPKKKKNRYIGSAQCKNCHDGADKGHQFELWSKRPHANAFKVLSTPAAKKVGTELGIDDPAKSEKCLKCHVTAYGVDKKQFRKSFKMEHGVQCESCHGPGEIHKKKRFREAQKKGTPPSPITADEIISKRSVEACKKCHNPESPTYKPFCLKVYMKDAEHLDPRKKRSKEALETLRNTCAPDCKTCADKKAASKKADGK